MNFESNRQETSTSKAPESHEAITEAETALAANLEAAVEEVEGAELSPGALSSILSKIPGATRMK